MDVVVGEDNDDCCVVMFDSGCSEGGYDDDNMDGDGEEVEFDAQEVDDDNDDDDCG